MYLAKPIAMNASYSAKSLGKTDLLTVHLTQETSHVQYADDAALSSRVPSHINDQPVRWGK